MILFYQIAIAFYYGLVRIWAFRNTKAAQLLAGQAQSTNFTKQTNPTIWLHCASVGEFEQGLPVLERMLQLKPNIPFVCTFFSPSGYQYALKKFPHWQIAYLPPDKKNQMEAFVQKVNPQIVLIVKYEFWYNWIHILRQQNIPVCLVSGIFRPQQIFFKPIIGSFFTRILHQFTHLFVQDENSRALLSTVNVNQVTVTGDTRFDRVIQNLQNPLHDDKIIHFINDQHCVVAGSVWNHDIPVLQGILQGIPDSWKMIVAPHEINHFSTAMLINEICFYSTYQPATDAHKKILVIDTVGILSKLYKFASLVYVGGGFGKGLHNILEPAVFGHPICIGPKFKKFNEAIALVEMQCAFVVHNATESRDIAIALTQDINRRKKIYNKMTTYVTEQANAAQKIVVYLQENGYY